MDISPLLKSHFLPIHEAAFYRRDLNSDSTLSYHNHVLQGCYLRYIVHPLKHNEVPTYRYVLVAGTRKGVMREMKLSPSSEVSVVKLITAESSENRTALNVTGIDAVTSSRVTWQLVMPSMEAETGWKKALEAAKWSREDLESSSEIEYELLRDITWKLSQGVPIKSRLHKFTVYPNCFLGVVGVRYLMQAFSLSSTNAIILGNKLLSAGMIEHVTHEHAFCDGRRFYRILVGDSTPLNSMTRVGPGEVEDDMPHQVRSYSRPGERLPPDESAAYLMQLVTKYKRKYKRTQKELARAGIVVTELEGVDLPRVKKLGGTSLQHQLFICQMLMVTGAVALYMRYHTVATCCAGAVCILAVLYDASVICSYLAGSANRPPPVVASVAASDVGESEGGSEDGIAASANGSPRDVVDPNSDGEDSDSDHDGDELDFAEESDFADTDQQVEFARPSSLSPQRSGAMSSGLSMMRRALTMNRPAATTGASAARVNVSGNARLRGSSGDAAIADDESHTQRLRKRVGSFMSYNSKQ
jgi:hypothetical protein